MGSSELIWGDSDEPFRSLLVNKVGTYPNRNEGRLKFNLPYVDSGMFYDDFGRLNFNLPEASYKLINWLST